MAPEQIGGDAVGPPADVYALGQVLWELMAEHRLYREIPVAEVLRTKLSDVPPALDLPEDLPGRAALTDLVSRCLAFDPQSRPVLPELRRSLGRIACAPQVSTPRLVAPVMPTPTPLATEAPAPVLPPAKRRAGLAAALLGAALAAGGTAAWLLLRQGAPEVEALVVAEPPRPPAPAPQEEARPKEGARVLPAEVDAPVLPPPPIRSPNRIEREADKAAAPRPERPEAAAIEPSPPPKKAEAVPEKTRPDPKPDQTGPQPKPEVAPPVDPLKRDEIGEW
jgi:hypothetical protein